MNLIKSKSQLLKDTMINKNEYQFSAGTVATFKSPLFIGLLTAQAGQDIDISGKGEGSEVKDGAFLKAGRTIKIGEDVKFYGIKTCLKSGGSIQLSASGIELRSRVTLLQASTAIELGQSAVSGIVVCWAPEIKISGPLANEGCIYFCSANNIIGKNNISGNGKVSVLSRDDFIKIAAHYSR